MRITMVVVLFIAGRALANDSTAKESTEHALAIRRQAEAQRIYAEAFNKQRILGEKILRRNELFEGLRRELKENPRSADSITETRNKVIRCDCTLKVGEVEKVNAEAASSKQSLDRATAQVEAVDDCVALYSHTIDMKTSDLTTRETKLISACTALDLYPPAK